MVPFVEGTLQTLAATLNHFDNQRSVFKSITVLNTGLKFSFFARLDFPIKRMFAALTKLTPFSAV